MRWRGTLVVAALLLIARCAFAVFPEGSTGLALPCAEGVVVDGSRLGDADYDPSRPEGGRVRFGDGLLSCAALYQTTDLDDKGSSFSAITLMLENVTGPGLAGQTPVISPYLAAGVSYLTMAVEVLGSDAADDAWVLQFGAGAGVRLTDELTLDLRYRYLSPLERTMRLHGKPAYLDLSRHNLLVGMRYAF